MSKTVPNDGRDKHWPHLRIGHPLRSSRTARTVFTWINAVQCSRLWKWLAYRIRVVKLRNRRN